MKKISVIIPVYNCEKYIEECLDSVLKQTLSEIEIICIDDGSVDSSIEKIQKYVLSDERIILLRQENQGQGIARNNGLKHATGKYVAFLDADDFYLDEDALEKMYLLCEEKKVSVCGSFRKNLESYGLKETHIIEHDIEAAKQKTVLTFKENQIDFEFQNFIFSRELLLNHNIFFPKYRRFEDPVFLVQALYTAHQFVIADVYLYCYRVPNAVQRGGADKTVDLLSGMIDNLLFASEHGLDVLFQNTVKHIDYEHRYLITHDLQENDIRIMEKLLEATKIIRKHNKRPDYVVNPLKDLVSGYLDYRRNYEKRIAEILKAQEDIILYGAGNLASIFMNYLEEVNQMKKVKYVMISSEVCEGQRFCDIPMISIQDEEQVAQLKDMQVFIVTTGTYHKEIIGNLENNGFQRFEAVDDAFLFEYAGR